MSRTSNQASKEGTYGQLYINSPKNTRRNHPLHGRGGQAFEAERKAEIFAETLDSNFRSKTDDYIHERFHRKTRQEVKDFLAGPPLHIIPLLNHSKPRKYLKEYTMIKHPVQTT